MRVGKKWLLVWLLLLFSIAQVDAAEKSFHFGFVHPNGVDLIGYSVETKMDNNLYWYYTFGLPSFAAIGITYYSNHDGNGMTGTLGAGLGILLHASIAYQVNLGNRNFLKLGAGVVSGISYNGTIPVISYEHRF